METYLIVKPGFNGNDVDVISQEVFDDMSEELRTSRSVVYVTNSVIDAFDMRDNYRTQSTPKWLMFPQSKPADGERVIVIRRGYGDYWEPAVYNETHECWDDAEGDDYMCELEDVVKFFKIPEA